jgi:hypothetical protein
LLQIADGYSVCEHPIVKKLSRQRSRAEQRCTDSLQLARSPRWLARLLRRSRIR